MTRVKSSTITDTLVPVKGVQVQKKVECSYYPRLVAVSYLSHGICGQTIQIHSRDMDGNGKWGQGVSLPKRTAIS